LLVLRYESGDHIGGSKYAGCSFVYCAWDFREQRGLLGGHSLRMWVKTLVLGRRERGRGTLRRVVGRGELAGMGRSVDLVAAERGKW